MRLPVRVGNPIDDFLCARSSASLDATLIVSRSGVVLSRYLRPPKLETGGIDGGVFVALLKLYCLLTGNADCTADLSGSGCCETYSLGELRIRPISVVALDGALNRASSSSSGSSVPRRVLLRSREVRRFVIELCVGVLLSADVYRGGGRVLPVRRLLLRSSSRLRALGLDLIREISEFTPNRWL